MKKAQLTLLSLVFSFSLIAQVDPGNIALAKSTMKIEREVIFNQNMNLNQEDGEVFWPIFEAYEEEKSKHFETSLKNFAMLAENFDGMSDENAKAIINSTLKNQQKNIKLLMKYQKKIAKVLGQKTAFRFVQIEQQINALLKTQILDIPLLEDKE